MDEVRIMNQILDIVCLLANFHPNSLDFIRQLQRWIGGIDWWRWLVKCQLARNIDQWLVPSVWHLESEAPRLFKDGFSTRSQMASRTPRSNHRSSRSRIITFSVSIWCPDVLECSKIAESTWYSEELGHLCWLRRALRDCLVSPT